MTKKTEEAIRALGASVDAACNAALDGGLSVDQIGYVLASALGTCLVLTREKSTPGLPPGLQLIPDREDLEGVARFASESIRKVILERLTTARYWVEPKPGEKNRDERFCDHCDEYTMHDIIDSTHERDSSSDWRECLVCGWTYNGLDGYYAPP